MKKATFALCVFSMILLGGFPLRADDRSKVDFIIDLFDKVEWPAGSETANTIYVIGESSVVTALESSAAESTKSGKIVNIKKISVDEEFNGCRMLFIASNDLGALAKILKKVKGTSILTVSDVDGFARYGVMINILVPGNDSKLKVGLVINKMTVRDAGLKIDEGLMEKADKTFG